MANAKKRYGLDANVAFRNNGGNGQTMTEAAAAQGSANAGYANNGGNGSTWSQTQARKEYERRKAGTSSTPLPYSVDPKDKLQEYADNVSAIRNLTGMSQLQVESWMRRAKNSGGSYYRGYINPGVDRNTLLKTTAEIRNATTLNQGEAYMIATAAENAKEEGMRRGGVNNGWVPRQKVTGLSADAGFASNGGGLVNDTIAPLDPRGAELNGGSWVLNGGSSSTQTQIIGPMSPRGADLNGGSSTLTQIIGPMSPRGADLNGGSSSTLKQTPGDDMAYLKTFQDWKTAAEIQDKQGVSLADAVGSVDQQIRTEQAKEEVAILMAKSKQTREAQEREEKNTLVAEETAKNYQAIEDTITYFEQEENVPSDEAETTALFYLLDYGEPEMKEVAATQLLQIYDVQIAILKKQEDYLLKKSVGYTRAIGMGQQADQADAEREEVKAEIKRLEKLKYDIALKAGYKELKISDLGLVNEKTQLYYDYSVELGKARKGLPNNAEAIWGALQDDRFRVISNKAVVQLLSSMTENGVIIANKTANPTTLAFAATAGLAGGAVAGLPGAVSGLTLGYGVGLSKATVEMEANLAYGQMINAGYSPEEAEQVALLVTGVTAATEVVNMVGIPKIASVLKRGVGTSGIAQWLIDTMTQATGGTLVAEGGQAVIGNATPNVTGDDIPSHVSPSSETAFWGSTITSAAGNAINDKIAPYSFHPKNAPAKTVQFSDGQIQGKYLIQESLAGRLGPEAYGIAKDLRNLPLLSLADIARLTTAVNRYNKEQSLPLLGQ